jgi:DNA polymerase-1
MRRAAKAVNFGIIYGISPFGLARNTGLTTQKAKDFIARYFLTYPGVLEYMDSNVEYAKKNGYIRSLSGRIRFFPELKSPNHNIRSFGERAALNMPLQGSAADIIKIAMLKVSRALKDGGYKAKLILQVHDELVIDTPLDEAEAVKKLLVENMESAAALKVPLVAEAKSGYDWYSVK